MKTIIPNKDGYAVVEWITPPQQVYSRKDKDLYRLSDIEQWKQQLASQPSTLVHPDYHIWAKENLYQPVEDDRIEYKDEYSQAHFNAPTTGTYVSKEPVNLVSTYAIPKRPIDAILSMGDNELRENLAEKLEQVLFKPKQPVEVKERGIVITPALPVEKEGEVSGFKTMALAELEERIKYIKQLMAECRKEEPVNTAVYNAYFNAVSALYSYSGFLKGTPDTAPPAEDWVSVGKEAEQYALKETPSMGNSHKYRAEFFLNELKYLKDNFNITRR